MTTLPKSTKSKRKEEIERQWHLIDMKQQILGRISSEIAKFLQGKHKVDYTPHADMGDYVVVINAKQMTLTGRKAKTKTYVRYSGYPGGLRKVTFQEEFDKDPARIIKHAVSGMLPKNKLRSRRLTRLYIFPEDSHTFTDKFKANN